jgi:excisionase family DNA binding protein
MTIPVATLPPYLTAREICEALRVSKPTLYRNIQRGRFPEPIKFGRTSRWPLDAVKAALGDLPQVIVPDRPASQRQG